MTDFKSLVRPNFFPGQLLTAEDLTQEQDYVIEKFKRHNRTLHGFGIVSGLETNMRSGEVVVEPGLALDCEGNELVAETLTPISLAAAQGTNIYLQLRYFEQCIDNSSTRESVEFSLANQNSNQNHRHSGGRWLPCGQPHGLTIARLRRIPQGWRVDRRYRPPRVK